MINSKTVESVLNEIVKKYKCFNSEAQFRDTFAIELSKECPNIKIYPEYTPAIKPKTLNIDEDVIHFDLLVSDGKENILFEFKYKTKKFHFLTEQEIVLANQEDTTNGRYAVWKDIQRIECYVNDKKANIDKGYMVFVTNYPTYFATPDKNTASYNFSIAPGVHKKAKVKNWLSVGKKGSIQKKNIKPLCIKNDYCFKYEKLNQLVDIDTKEEHTFYKMILEIK